ncbi:MAG TPA: hypothetical protein VGB63_07990 [Pedobacter sp.]|jgi:hypothetical protein
MIKRISRIDMPCSILLTFLLFCVSSSFGQQPLVLENIGGHISYEKDTKLDSIFTISEIIGVSITNNYGVRVKTKKELADFMMLLKYAKATGGLES